MVSESECYVDCKAELETVKEIGTELFCFKQVVEEKSFE